MAVAYLQEFQIQDGDTSTTNYDAVAGALNLTEAPDGLLIHTAGFDHDGGVFRIFDVWESREQGERFPEWVLDKIGVEVMLANRIAMGPGVAPPRFRWVSYVDALMLPLSTTAERAATPDYRVLYPLEGRLLRRYLTDLHMTKVPPTLAAYLRTVVTPTLERQRQNGCVAVKFEAAYLRAPDEYTVADDVVIEAKRGDTEIELTCADVCFDITMWSAVILRIASSSDKTPRSRT